MVEQDLSASAVADRATQATPQAPAGLGHSVSVTSADDAGLVASESLYICPECDGSGEGVADTSCYRCNGVGGVPPLTDAELNNRWLRDTVNELTAVEETLTRQRDQWRNEAAFLLSVIDYQAEAEAPFDEMEPGDVAAIALIRSALSAQAMSAGTAETVQPAQGDSPPARSEGCAQ